MYACMNKHVHAHIMCIHGCGLNAEFLSTLTSLKSKFSFSYQLPQKDPTTYKETKNDKLVMVYNRYKST